ncbi:MULTISPECIES: MurR/RpiR family transcriptional regulator [unclassified Mesorhizobium]|uniref:MurR/RpiR family transcriptional regulator n=1 Tax=unclassified Mesorhizobium TaxID=325217 RepID=UPI000FCCC354|nr:MULTISPECIES: MurR/RpiR family transcriptional regulator [unclassified Mesorhizobium]RUW97177.1 MurR/RpiR family transcriptional regulator [Mesorhizobium sp. M8A.F.Ca.ET.023.01.1.1]RUW99071.1 MurR/RpiR family transcriptional regulator [Mesorhizobium sp. M8A.F.Ca.ET.059.01.1.1]RVD49685.1 MurR/RpiR family transcriptional regulator [Mesorhizobium sp. M8A.F.Ca.ET.023.02.2.1]TGR38514.1 MurR/RpiR family transcriptional regulator [bacterium M00.F.Ca.ET.199.01.1.1]TGU27980.1 MurR/RpiR family transc
MKTPADIITRLQLMSQDGTKSDRRLASLVLSDLDFASKAAISEIAARVGVSEPTVTRFCRNLGCEGLRDFKFYLAQAIAIGGQYLSPEPLSRDAREQRIASAITEAAIASIQRVSENLDMTTLVDVAARLAASGNVLCIGSGGISSMMATEMQNRLFRLGLPVLAQIDGQLQRMYAAVATPDTTVVAFSVSGYARSVIEAVQVAQQYGAATVAVTAPDSALAKVADTVIHLQPLEDGNIYKPTSSRYALLAIVDMIVTSVAETRGPKVLENLRRIKQSVNTLKVDDPRLPLGD